MDPVCTRPIFYRLSAGHLLVADKLATIALNSEDQCELNWDAVLEAMLLGSLYRYNLTSLAGAEELAPGEAIVFRDLGLAATVPRQFPADPGRHFRSPAGIGNAGVY